MSFQSLITTIDTKLNTITQLETVLKYHTTDFTGYPAASFEMGEDENIVETTTENLIDYNFDIVVHQEISVAGREKAHDILAGAVDAIINAFNDDCTLGGAVDFVKPVTGSKGMYNAGNASVLFFNLKVRCVKLVVV